MKPILVMLVAIGLVLSRPHPAVAQADSPAESDSTHIAAVRELCDVLGLAQQRASAPGVMLDQQVRLNPALAPYRDVLANWSQRYLSWEQMEPEIVRLYAATFSDQEVRAITAFYRTPAGQKALARMPELTQKGVELGAAAAQQHMPDLKRMIEEQGAKSGRTDSRL
ncbi:MAG: DUF2059 domain-containing protein [Candidatus Eisenbacteria bacterium]